MMVMAVNGTAMPTPDLQVDPRPGKKAPTFLQVWDRLEQAKRKTGALGS